MCKNKWFCAAVAGVLSLGFGSAVYADMSAFIGTIGFDKSANLDRSMGLGVRWGRSSSIIGGETSLMFAFPQRKLNVQDLGTQVQDLKSERRAMSLFYEGRLVVNIPLKVVTPFANVGLGAILTTSTDDPKDQLPTEIGGISLPEEERQKVEAVNKALKAVSKVQNNREFSYGVGARKSLNDRLDLRVDLRQYMVFSVKALAEQKIKEQIAGQVGEQTGLTLPPVEKAKTVRYEELSLGVNFRF